MAKSRAPDTPRATPMGRLEWKNRPIKVELLTKKPITREGTTNE